MVKLVRLESDTSLTESQFTNNLAIALHLGKNASVALKTLTMQFKEPPLVINDTNNRIDFTTSAIGPITTLRKCDLPFGSYTISQLMQVISKRMNSMLQSYTLNTTDTGFEWKASTTGDNTTGYTSHIAYKRTDPKSAINASDCTFKVNGVDNTMSFNAGVFTKDVSDNATMNAGLVTNDFVNRGAWSVGLQVGAQTTGTDISGTKWAFGIGDSQLKDETNEALVFLKMICGFLRSDVGTYAYKKGGLYMDTDLPIVEGDIIRISKHITADNRTTVVYSVKQGTNDTVDFDGDVIQNGIAETIGSGGKYCFLKVGDDADKISFSDISFTPSGLVAVTDGVYTEVDNVTNIIKNENLTAVSPSVVTVIFPTEDVRLLLGFKLPLVTNDSLDYDFASTGTIAFNIFNNDLVVCVPELPLNGYDHGEKQTRNMVMVVSSGEVRNSLTARGSETYELSFTETAQPLWIGLDNRQTTFTAPQLSIRVTSEGSTLPMEGKISALLLFRDEDHD